MNKNTHKGWLPNQNDERWRMKDSSKFYDDIIKAANIIAQNKPNYIVTTGKCSCCGATMEDETSSHDPECIWYEEN